jgi:hypothetical protein
MALPSGRVRLKSAGGIPDTGAMTLSSRSRTVFLVGPAIGIVVVAATLSACESGSPTGAPPDTTRATTSATAPATTFACSPTRDDCTPEEVIATVRQLYEAAGATPEEAACLAPITGEGKHAVNEAFDMPSEKETRSAIKCVGSEERLRAIAESLARYFEQHPNG